MDSLIAKCREHEVDPRTYLRDVFLRVGKVSDVRADTLWVEAELGAPLVEADRASIVERLMHKVDG